MKSLPSLNPAKRERLLLDPGWRFHLGDIPFPKGHGGWTKSGNFSFGHLNPMYNDSNWRQVNLPHDFVVEGAFAQNLNVSSDHFGIAGMVAGQTLDATHGSLPTGIGWYRKTFFIPETDRGRKLRIQFDGISRNCQVWFNRHFLGQHLSGYTSFSFDISDIADYGGTNILTVRADATEYEGWFYEGGGIYRHTWLEKHALLHVSPDGVFVTTEVEEEGARAIVKAQITVRNDGDIAANVQLRTTILDAAGRPAGTETTILPLPIGDEATTNLSISLPQPNLWSVDEPNLYTLVTTLTLNNEVIDETQTVFGVRSFHFDPDLGFFLNGKPLMLKGVCCHQDHAGVGAAIPDALQDYRIRRLKEMGCNAYRCSHNPPTPELLDACDRLGMLVMDEHRLLGSSPEVLSQLESLVLRDRNHPSIIMWSIGNEEPLQATESGTRMAKTMTRLIKRLDPTRLTTMAMNANWGKGLSAVVDVQGCNYLSGGSVDDFHRDFPKQPVIYTESGSTVSTRGIYEKDPLRGYMAAYDTGKMIWGETCEQHWVHCLERPFVAGTFIWTGFDYRGEPSPYAWPCINSHFGLLDMCGFAKDNFYYYQAWWSDRTVLHVFPHWNWQDCEGKPIDVWVHSNCDAVELFLNKKSLGRKTVKAGCHLEWKVKYAPGTLLAKGWKNGKLVKTTVVETTGAPAALRLEPDRTTLSGDGEDTTVINVAVVDAKGRVVPTAENHIQFSINENGRILGVGNGNPSSHESDKAPARRAFNGWCQVVVQTNGQAGKLTLTAKSFGLGETETTLTVKPASPRPFLPGLMAPVPLKFECSQLQPAPANIAKAPMMKKGLTLAPVVAVGNDGFYDIRSFHGGKQGMLYIRSTFTEEKAASVVLLYGSDGPVNVWVNGKAIACQPTSTNPAREGEYNVPIQLKQGENELVLGLVTNHGRAWGVFARIARTDGQG